MSRIATALDALRERLAASELGQQLWARYERASPRRQLAVQIGTIALLLALLLFGLVLPLHDYSQRSDARYREQLDVLAWMEANRHRVVPEGEPSSSGDSLLATVTHSASTAGLAIRRYEPTGEEGLSLWLDNASFGALVRWLEQLERDHRIVAVDISARRRTEPGRVDVRVILEG